MPNLENNGPNEDLSSPLHGPKEVNVNYLVQATQQATKGCLVRIPQAISALFLGYMIALLGMHTANGKIIYAREGSGSNISSDNFFVHFIGTWMSLSILRRQFTQNCVANRFANKNQHVHEGASSMNLGAFFKQLKQETQAVSEKLNFRLAMPFIVSTGLLAGSYVPGSTYRLDPILKSWCFGFACAVSFFTCPGYNGSNAQFLFQQAITLIRR